LRKQFCDRCHGSGIALFAGDVGPIRIQTRAQVVFVQFEKAATEPNASRAHTAIHRRAQSGKMPRDCRAPCCFLFGRQGMARRERRHIGIRREMLFVVAVCGPLHERVALQGLCCGLPCVALGDLRYIETQHAAGQQAEQPEQFGGLRAHCAHVGQRGK
jgi:hypothetical protein